MLSCPRTLIYLKDDYTLIARALRPRVPSKFRPERYIFGQKGLAVRINQGWLEIRPHVDIIRPFSDNGQSNFEISVRKERRGGLFGLSKARRTTLVRRMLKELLRIQRTQTHMIGD